MTEEEIAKFVLLNGAWSPTQFERLLEERRRLLEALKKCCSDLESTDTSDPTPSEYRAVIAFAEESYLV